MWIYVYVFIHIYLNTHMHTHIQMKWTSADIMNHLGADRATQCHRGQHIDLI